MPPYSFIVDDGINPSETTTIDLTDLEHAKTEAIRTAGEMLADIGTGTIWNGVPWTLVVNDEDGQRALKIHFMIESDPVNLGR